MGPVKLEKFLSGTIFLNHGSASSASASASASASVKMSSGVRKTFARPGQPSVAGADVDGDASRKISTLAAKQNAPKPRHNPDADGALVLPAPSPQHM